MLELLRLVILKFKFSPRLRTRERRLQLRGRSQGAAVTLSTVSLHSLLDQKLTKMSPPDRRAEPSARPATQRLTLRIARRSSDRESRALRQDQRQSGCACSMACEHLLYE